MAWFFHHPSTDPEAQDRTFPTHASAAPCNCQLILQNLGGGGGNLCTKTSLLHCPQFTLVCGHSCSFSPLALCSPWLGKEEWRCMPLLCTWLEIASKRPAVGPCHYICCCFQVHHRDSIAAAATTSTSSDHLLLAAVDLRTSTTSAGLPISMMSCLQLPTKERALFKHVLVSSTYSISMCFPYLRA